MRTRAIALSVLLSTLSTALLTGCASDRPEKTPAPSPTASPKKPFEVEATVEGLDVTMTDPAGKPIARLQADVGTVGPSDAGAARPRGDALGAIRGGTATLYQQGRPIAKLTAETLTADRAKRTVTGTGNVKVQTLDQKETTAIRADTMRWEYDNDRITGRGNVLVTRAQDARLPAERFEADTEMRSFTLFGSDEPATGSY